MNTRNRARNTRYAARHPVQMLQCSPTVASMRDRARNRQGKIRDHVSDIPARTRLAASRVRVGASNAWYRAAGRRISGTRTAMSNARNRRTAERGRVPRRDGVKAAVTSRTPVLRDRINPATGRPRRDDTMMHRSRNEGLARMKATAGRDPQYWPPAAWERVPRPAPARTRPGRGRRASDRQARTAARQRSTR